MVLIQATVLDATHLELAKPIAVSRGGHVLVMVTEATGADAERRQWLDGSAATLQNAYSDAEPDYTPSMVREANPGYGA